VCARVLCMHAWLCYACMCACVCMHALSMHACMHMYAWLCLCMYAYVCACCMYVCVRMYVPAVSIARAHVDVGVCAYVDDGIDARAHDYVRMHQCIYVCASHVCICVCVYVYAGV
jgi:hypothetical protein